MAMYEIKFDANGQDFLEFESSSAQEAFEAFIEQDEKKLDAPIVVWVGMEKIATFRRHIGGKDEINELINSKKNTNHHRPTTKSFQQNNQAIEDKLDMIYNVMNHIRWIGLSFCCMFAIAFITQCTGG